MARLAEVNQSQSLLDVALLGLARRISEHHQLLRTGSAATPASLLAAHQMVELSRAHSDEAKNESIKAQTASTSSHADLRRIDQQRAVLERRKTWCTDCLESHLRAKWIASESGGEDDIQDLDLWRHHSTR